MIPVLVDPVGDPAGVRVGVRRLVDAAESLSVSARWLADSNQEAVLAWESNAQRLFSIMAETFSQVISGSSSVATDMGNALERYASVVDQCQGEVRLCRQRLNELAAATPPGFAPDQGAVNGLVAQANNAYARVAQAAKELSATALWLIGGSSGSSNAPMAGSAPGASFISHAHSAGLASTHPAAAGFDTQAAHIQAQMTGIMGSFTAYVTGSSPAVAGLYPTSMTIGGSHFSSTISGPDILAGAGVIGGSTFSSNIGFVATGLGSTTLGGESLAHGTQGGPPLGSVTTGVGSGVYMVYDPPAFSTRIQAGTAPTLNFPARLPIYDPIIQGIIVPQQLNQLGDAQDRLNRSLSNLHFNTPYDPYSIDGS